MNVVEEAELPRPLTDVEIKDGIAFTVATAVREALDKSCKLFGQSYPKFKGEIQIKLLLDNFGDQYIDNHFVKIDEPGVEGSADPVTVEETVVIEETPPNLYRRKTQQAIPTLVTTNGRSEEKKVKYQKRKMPE